MKALIALTATLLPAAGISAPTAPDIELWRLDCGSIEVRDLNMFSDSFAYPEQTKALRNGCYLIRNGQQYLLWDTGLAQDIKADPALPVVPTPGPELTGQLAKIGVAPEQITRIGISHAHFDHMGQAATFPSAKLLIGAGDWKELSSDKPGFGIDPSLARPWLDGAPVEAVTSDLDIFGDGSAIMLSMPGHTEGETALLVNLPQNGPVLLSGDVAHFAEQLANDGVPPFNVSRAESLASMGRMRAVTQATGARLVVQHDATHVERLPASPASAR